VGDAQRSLGRARTDADGRFIVRGLPPGPTCLVARCAGFAETRQDLQIAAQTEAVVVLRRGASVSGRVRVDGTPPTLSERLAMQEREPLLVALMPADVDLPDSARDLRFQNPKQGVDVNGHFRFDQVAEGRYRLAAALGYRMVASEPFDVSGSAALVRELDLPPPATIRGRIVDAVHRPLTFETLRLESKPLALRPSPQAPRARSDENGRFQFDDLGAGRYFLMRDSERVLLNADLIAARRIEIVAGQEVERQIVVGSLGLDLEGQVRLGTGQPFRQVGLVASGANRPECVAPVDHEGRFRVRRGQPGEFSLWFADDLVRPTVVGKRRFDAAWSGRASITFEAARLRGNLGLETARSTLELRLAADETSSLVDAVRITLRTDEQGSFDFGRLPAGDYRLRIVSDRRAQADEWPIRLREDTDFKP
ncbi:MAG: carboxypeptidase regulatory-like domain-containing protein, partial [Planctomycetes bacterium]|nr:carboxypeptidase regulatory-like domain-containing protein [Planctomycetota bacterium]